MSYAMAYPFGICGILLVMWLIRLFPISHRRGPAGWREERERRERIRVSCIYTINVAGGKPQPQQMAIQDVPMLNNDNIVVSRLKRGSC
ncbi:hypothetical protein M8494_32730 [Serratia ureilytica]